MRILLTGASGFIGRKLQSELIQRHNVVVAQRRDQVVGDSSVIRHRVGEIDAHTDWGNALSGVDVVVHLAGRAHVQREASERAAAEFHRVNVEGTENLARQAAANGVRRFIFISSIGVNGYVNKRPFTEADLPDPREPYAASKLSAERALQAVASESSMEWVVIRPPLVYGPGAPGNFSRLLHAVERGVPLPLGRVRNRRTLVALENLTSLIRTCVEHPAAANQVFLAGDATDLSTTELLRRLGEVLGVSTRLLPVPVRLMELCAIFVGRRQFIQKLCGSLQIDISKARTILDWTPPLSLEEGLARLAPSDKAENK